MERLHRSRQPDRHSNDNRCVKYSMGSLDSGAPGTGFLEQANVVSPFKLPGTVRSVVRINFIEAIHREQDCSNIIRQHNYHRVHQQAWRINPNVGRYSETHSSRGNRHECQISGLLPIGGSKLEGRSAFSSEFYIRVEATPKFVQNVRPTLGSSSYRQIRINDDHTTSSVQQLVLGSPEFGRGCFGPNRLEQIQQFRQLSVWSSTKSFGNHKNPEGYSHSNCSSVGRSNLVPDIKINVDRQSYTSSCFAADSRENRTKSRAVQEQEVAPVRLESLWTTRLRCLGWSKRAARQSLHSLAQSTLRTYSGYVDRYIDFCKQKEVNFADESNISVISDFLTYLADQSNRPESMLKVTSAAITCLFEALGKISPMRHPDLKRLISGIVKSGTSAPMQRTKPMPIQPFIDLFTSFGENESMVLTFLRMKALTLVALTCMTRPSDLAPKGVTLNKSDLSVNNIILSLDNVVFHDDHSLTIHFFGIKNDTSRSGFEVNIPHNVDNPIMDPVSCLKEYIKRTDINRDKTERPLFISLTAPFKALSSARIASILDDVIALAGLADKGFSAKSFRPTGATIAVNSGVLPETVMQIGRWKTKEVFLNHYVYPNAPQSYTTNLLK